ncbi:BLOC-2 complex member HPS6 [Trichomycterus rosablanca]|uniref:BLOC-2 complex member HPS6 n=1 Tax=Trichomycterus rosablanca TaxID=2290929 RepID=UPI002F356D8D
MTRHLEQVTDFGDFTKGKDLKEFLKRSSHKDPSKNCLSDVRISPDGRHLHVILHSPKPGLMTYDKYHRPHLVQSKEQLDLMLTRNVPIVELIYFNQNATEYGDLLLGIIFENGKTEIWKFSERKSGWNLIQTVDLCNSARAKIVSVCIIENVIVWCEERPPSESSSSYNVARSIFRYCICKRTFHADDGGISFGGVKIALHNNPRYKVIGAGDLIYLLPDTNNDSCVSVSKLFLSWSPQHDIYKVHSTSHGTLLIRNTTANKELDFKRLVTDCIGFLFTTTPHDLYGFCPERRGSLLLLLSSGWICRIQKDGVLHQIYKLPDNILTTYGIQNSLNIYGDVIALTLGRILFLIDVNCGIELERIALKSEGLLFVNCAESHFPQMLTDDGIFLVVEKELEPKFKPHNINSSALLVEAVFEEACKYYQQRSLSSTQLTVEKLKKGGMFQAPISLAAIIRDYLANHILKTTEKHYLENEKLLICLDSELKSLVSMEDTKTAMVKASKTDLQSYTETLIQQELCRLFSSEIDQENLQYLNSIFQLFPNETWQAVQAVLQLRCNGEGSLSSKAPSELWKIILSPVQTVSNYCNSQQKLLPANGALPIFELLCQSIIKFQPTWLPRFLDLAQQQSISSSVSSWSYGVKEGLESVPLYKRALTILPCKGAYQDLEVELLLCSQRPNAVMQALHMLIGLSSWERVIHVAKRFCRQSPLLNKEIFTTLLSEVPQHRDLDPFLDVLWALCPEDMTVTEILNIVLQKMPSTVQSSAPFQRHLHDSQLTIGLLKPLLSKVLQRERRSSHRYADILQSPTLPPPTPPRQVQELTQVNTGFDIDLKEKTPFGAQVNPV